MAKDYKIVKTFKGYRTKKDKTKLPSGYLVNGSQNVLSTDGDNIKIREGYTLFGAANDTLNPIISSYDWFTHSGSERNLRSDDDELEFYDTNTSAWVRIADSWSSINFNFAEYWDANEAEDILLFVNGDDNVYAWSGGVAVISSTTANTITKTGVTSWAEERFISNGTDYDKKVLINGTVYTYSGGESTTTLTGVTPDPTGEADGSLVTQTVTTIPTTPASNVKNDLIAVLDNQVWYGSLTSRVAYKSKVNDFKDVTFSTPRLVGEGALLTLDASPTGFSVQEIEMAISAGKDQWYNSKFTLSDDLVNENLEIKRLKTNFGQSAISQAAITKIKNLTAFVSNEPTLETLGEIENIITTQSNPLSDPIKPDFNNLDFTNVHIKYFKNNIYIALPVESKLLIYNLEKGFWEAPQILPIRRLAIIDGELYGHSNAVPETYKLFTGNNDNGASIDAIAKFSYQNFGDRVNLKSFDEFYSEGYISSNTTLTVTINYDFDGFTSMQEFEINGSDDSILFQPITDNSLGQNSLGTQPLGNILDEVSSLSKFRQINTMIKQDFNEIQVVYSSNDIDQRWEILAFGPNLLISKARPISIKK